MKPQTHKPFAAFALPLLLAGCATAPPPAKPSASALITEQKDKDATRRAEFDAALSRWHGAPVAELKTKLGKPTTVTPRNDGNTVYAFTRAAFSDPGTGYAKFSCTVRYVVDDKTQRVQSHKIEGC